MSHTELIESEDSTITVSEMPDEEERHKHSLEHLVTEIRDDPDSTSTEKRLASALIALKESD